MRTFKRTVVLVAVVAGLSGCANNESNAAEEAALAFLYASREEACSMSAGESPEEIERCEQAAREAGDTEGTTESDYEQPPQVVRTDEWQNGQLVEISYQQSSEDPVFHYAYGLIEENGDWKIARFNQIDQELVGREDAACRTLAESELEDSECG